MRKSSIIPSNTGLKPNQTMQRRLKIPPLFLPRRCPSAKITEIQRSCGFPRLALGRIRLPRISGHQFDFFYKIGASGLV